MNATGEAKTIESRRSMTPPWPGRMLLMSLMPSSRLTMDSARSPAVAAATMPTARTTPTHQGLPSRKTAARTPTTMAPAMEPAKPSQVFLGLIFGAIGCLPREAPTR